MATTSARARCSIETAGSSSACTISSGRPPATASGRLRRSERPSRGPHRRAARPRRRDAWRPACRGRCRSTSTRTEAALVGGARRGAAARGDLGFEDALQPRRAARCQGRRRDLEIVEEHRAAELGAITEIEPGLQADEGDGAFGAHGAAHRQAGVARDRPEGMSSAEHRTASRIDRLDRRGDLGRNGPTRPGAEHRIDDHFAAARAPRRRRSGSTTTGTRDEVLPGAPRIALQLRRIRGRQHARVEAGGLREAREHVAVAAVVAAATDDRRSGAPAASACAAYAGSPRPRASSACSPGCRARGSRRHRGPGSAGWSRSQWAAPCAHYTGRHPPCRTRTRRHLAAIRRDPRCCRSSPSELGFAALGVADIDLQDDEQRLDSAGSRRGCMARWATWPATARGAAALRSCSPARCA